MPSQRHSRFSMFASVAAHRYFPITYYLPAIFTPLFAHIAYPLRFLLWKRP